MYQRELTIETHGEGEIVDLSAAVQDIVTASKIRTGLVTVFVKGSTVAVTTIEYETGVLSDLRRALDVMAPKDAAYEHDAAWGDGNGRSHVRAALIGPSITIPLQEGKLLTGTWQQIVMVELDVRPRRTRSVVCTVNGMKE
ncbi:secondary thiamine-phosphate synthase enzyme [Methanomicrobiaceae archaeon CYW5]|uniref:secondary thiamine-phosphate synthase enzyme YjbQ n=1 Tax=Methanovulcanius yangii TaxID=1789227 RepID=UPI0029CA8D8C|nr:secondary thiamine-phosphate synthase enzyme YjbQ [Methanovulcanius yangii]MBT8507450.1 secondary thiamine-phosphate synthase enzyme [Methanovulcanius yangii]